MGASPCRIIPPAWGHIVMTGGTDPCFTTGTHHISKYHYSQSMIGMIWETRAAGITNTHHRVAQSIYFKALACYHDQIKAIRQAQKNEHRATNPSAAFVFVYPDVSKDFSPKGIPAEQEMAYFLTIVINIDELIAAPNSPTDKTDQWQGTDAFEKDHALATEMADYIVEVLMSTATGEEALAIAFSDYANRWEKSGPNNKKTKSLIFERAKKYGIDIVRKKRK